MTRLSPIIAVALIICSTGSRSFADYVSTQLFELVSSADVIASGEIIEVRDKTFVLKTDEVLIGKRRDHIEIVRFQDWPVRGGDRATTPSRGEMIASRLEGG